MESLEKLVQLKLHSAVTLFEGDMKAIYAGNGGSGNPPPGSGVLGVSYSCKVTWSDCTSERPWHCCGPGGREGCLSIAWSMEHPTNPYLYVIDATCIRNVFED